MKPLITGLALMAMLNACANAASSLQSLASALQKTLDAGDFKAAADLGKIAGAPADLHFSISMQSATAQSIR